MLLLLCDSDVLRFDKAPVEVELIVIEEKTKTADDTRKDDEVLKVLKAMYLRLISSCPIPEASTGVQDSGRSDGDAQPMDVVQDVPMGSSSDGGLDGSVDGDLEWGPALVKWRKKWAGDAAAAAHNAAMSPQQDSATRQSERVNRKRRRDIDESQGDGVAMQQVMMQQEGKQQEGAEAQHNGEPPLQVRVHPVVYDFVAELWGKWKPPANGEFFHWASGPQAYGEGNYHTRAVGRIKSVWWS